MTWTTPTLVEICIGLEINGYLPAEFWSRPSTSLVAPCLGRRGRDRGRRGVGRPPSSGWRLGSWSGHSPSRAD